MKKSLMLMILPILFFMVGVYAVSASTFNLSNAAIKCDPSSLEKGGTALCYYVGIPTVADGVNAGFIMHAYSTSYLEIESLELNDNVTDGGSYWVGTKSSTGSYTSGTAPSGSTFACQFSDDDKNTFTTQSAVTNGCGLLYASTTNQFKATSGSALYSIPSTITSTTFKAYFETGGEYNGYMNLGYLKVKLSEDIPDNVSKCGSICARAWGISSLTDYGTGNQYECEELHQTSTPAQNFEEENTETGAFVSYALLAAGALIAVSAVAIAKKHSKIQKI